MPLSPQLQARLERTTNLPSPSRIAARIVDLARNDEVDLTRVAESIAADPALAAKVLRAANSALYAQRRRIYTLREALVVLGLNTTLTLALSFSLVHSLRARPTKGLDYPMFWRRSLLAATAAGALGDVLGIINPEELFLVGLIQDIGMLAIDTAIPTFYEGVATDCDQRRLSDYERQWLHADHADVGAWLIGRWHMPDYWQRAVIASDKPCDAAPRVGQAEATFASCIALSGDMADVWLSENARAVSPDTLQRASKLLALDASDLADALSRMHEQIPDAEALYETKLLNPRAAAVILERAQCLLAAS